jgi:hypothetical protein
MACNLRRIANLPIQEELKLRLLDFFQKPENQVACERLNQASDEQLVQMVQGISQKMGQQGPQQRPQNPMQAPPPSPGPQAAPSMQQPMRPQAPPGIPPNRVASVPKPMDMPLGQGIAQLPRRY